MCANSKKNAIKNRYVVIIKNVFFILSVIGFLSFSKDLKKISYYLILLSILLELLHIIIPNRGFEVADLLGNILGVLLSLILFKLFLFRRFR